MKEDNKLFKEKIIPLINYFFGTFIAGYICFKLSQDVRTYFRFIMFAIAFAALAKMLYSLGNQINDLLKDDAQFNHGIKMIFKSILYIICANVIIGIAVLIVKSIIMICNNFNPLVLELIKNQNLINTTIAFQFITLGFLLVTFILSVYAIIYMLKDGIWKHKWLWLSAIIFMLFTINQGSNQRALDNLSRVAANTLSLSKQKCATINEVIEYNKNSKVEYFVKDGHLVVKQMNNNQWKNASFNDKLKQVLNEK